MKYLLLFEELTGINKEETEIVYRDENMVCLIPKSVETSAKFGRSTNWCSTNANGFNHFGRDHIFFRFLFKNKRKLRLSYGTLEYNLASENGRHEFSNQLRFEENPFYTEKGKINSLEGSEDVKKLIELIPSECRKMVCRTIDKYIKNHRNKIKYKEANSQPEQPKLIKDFLDRSNGFEDIQTQFNDSSELVLSESGKRDKIIHGYIWVTDKYITPSIYIDKDKRRFVLKHYNKSKTYCKTIDELKELLPKHNPRNTRYSGKNQFPIN